MANQDQVLPRWITRKALPAVTVDGVQQDARGTPRGELLHQSVLGAKMHQSALEGSCFVATNATLGTAITGTAAPTAFSATVALMSLFNGNSVASGKDIVLHWLSLEPKAAGTNGTNFLAAMSLDSIQRFSSGGTAVVPVNPNMGDTTASGATLNVGALTAAAASAAVRRVWHGSLRTVIKVIGDKYLFTFGDSVPTSVGMPLEGTLQAFIPVQCPPIVIGPGCTWLLHEIAASQSVAATYEFSMCWSER